MRLSVVVPVYRVEAYLPSCLDSVLSHVGDDIEVVVVNDGSPDGCGAIIDRYAARDPRVRPVHLPANVGLGQARNAGFDRAAGEYVWFVDSDDWLAEGAMRLILDRLDRHRPDVLIVDHAEVFPDGRVVPRLSAGLRGGVPTPLHLSQRPQLLRLAQSACTKIAKRSFLIERGLRFLPGWYEDASFSHPLLMTARSIDVLDEVCYLYRQQTPGGITSSVSKRHFEVFEQYDRIYAYMDRTGAAYDDFRPELFRLMVNHYLVILGNQWRLPPELRRAFFKQVGDQYALRLPPGGYDVPAGVEGLKHRLVRRRAYSMYASLRRLHSAVVTWGRSRAATRVTAPVVPSPRPAGGLELAVAPIEAVPGPIPRPRPADGLVRESPPVPKP